MNFEWAPILPVVYAAGLVLAALLIAVLARVRAREFVWRGLMFVVLAVLLMNPVALNELRQSLPDKVVIVVDESASQKIGARDKAAEEALAHVQAELQKFPGVEPVVIRTAGIAAAGKGESTNLFGALRDALPGIPLGQVSGTILITDGQVHDAPDGPGALEKLGPFHAVLTGKRDEFDRKVTIVSAPKYGLLSQDITIAVKVEEFGRSSGGPVPLNYKQYGGEEGQATVTPGETREFTFTLDHPGQNVFEFSVPEAEGELTAINNTAPVIVNGVRDRLKVLLVSGSPHMGERAWRNLLKSDPSIDLVHFTILRSINSIDMTPSKELALIVFPVEELFQRKLKDFDLIIFDRYHQASLLTQLYFSNIAAYVQRGGAFLMAMGTDAEADEGVYKTPLADVLPVLPRTDDVIKGAYAPVLTEAGKKHPVTADIQRLYDKRPWGQWQTQVDVNKRSGETLMTGARDMPLLVVDKVGAGRVAVLASDNVWMWSKGALTRGPYSELLRNTAHWLMKEPELEEDYIKAEARGNVITVSRRDLTEAPPVTMTAPSGAQKDIILGTKKDGWASAEITAEQNGIYSFAAGEKKTFVVVGTARNEEFSDVHTTDEKLKDVVGKSGGGVVWFGEDKGFGLRALSPNARRFAGGSWLGLKKNNAYTVRQVESRALVPKELVLLLILGAMLLAWRRESGSR